MTEFGPQQLGRWLIIAGVVFVLTGALVVVLAKFGFFRLPGDLEFGGKNWRVYIPITSFILISIILTIIFWLINYFRH
jgi:hypothetical protein